MKNENKLEGTFQKSLFLDWSIWGNHGNHRSKTGGFYQLALVLEEIKNVLGNPFLLFSVILAVIGVVTDPTTKGICDSSQALGYSKPRDDTANQSDLNNKA